MRDFERYRQALLRYFSVEHTRQVMATRHPRHCQIPLVCTRSSGTVQCRRTGHEESEEEVKEQRRWWTRSGDRR